ncbi:SDR family oxidoreductase [Adhaeretor mobilis]|uniref:dTDP-4-dehydrorhamnose reductase n=1 Tax=Adhaeretor mobilis TaxID=1930276 RepID=A0A517MSU8_9BACT|nr:sugar nucleotide-binding protein [Adhaeretor mobilis]QDS97912.1 dTDP-4-dehydrorhamnose reductase [Adhaeretor mobilis]
MPSPENHSPALPLLVTGVAGVAGYNAFTYFSERHSGQVVGIRQENNWPLSGPNIFACDAEDRDVLERLFDEYEFGTVLNCAGNCALKSCELDSRLAWRTNVEGLTNLAAVVADRDVRLVHTSVDLVFAGVDSEVDRRQHAYQETDRPDPVTVYGKTMVAAEQLIADYLPAACTLRISLPMGISFNGHAGAIDWIQSRFAKNRPATLYYDEVRTPTYTDCLNRVYEQVLVTDLAGIFHAGGPRNLSLYEIAQVINRVGGYDPKLLQGCPRIEAGPMPPRAGNVTLDSCKLAAALGREAFDPWPFLPEHVPTDRRWHYERDGFAGSPELLAEVLYQNPRLGAKAAG